MPTCLKCKNPFPNRVQINGKQHVVGNRKYCLICSPFGSRNRRKIHEIQVRRRCRYCGKEPSGSMATKNICGSCMFNRRAEKMEDRVYEIVGNGCWMCPLDEGKSGRPLMDFHHVDREGKRFNVNKLNIANRRWDAVFAEMQKCALLCCLCHRRLHNGLLDNDEVRRRYEEKWAEINHGGRAAPQADL